MLTYRHPLKPVVFHDEPRRREYEIHLHIHRTPAYSRGPPGIDPPPERQVPSLLPTTWPLPTFPGRCVLIRRTTASAGLAC